MISVQVTFSEETFARLKRLSQSGQIDIETLLNAMPLLATPLLSEFDLTPVSQLSDEAVLSWADRHMDIAQSARLEELHILQKQRTLSPVEQDEEHILMQIYVAGQMRKLEALGEAIKRGLRTKGTV